MTTSQDTFASLISAAIIDLPRVALHLAREVHFPRLDVDYELARLERLAGQARDVVTADDSAERARQLLTFLHEQEGFHGDTTSYQDPLNSYLNTVLERRKGIPISLATLYIALAQQLAIPACGIGLPGHFIIGIGEHDVTLMLDLFHGRTLTARECVKLVRETVGYKGVFRPEWLNPTPTLDIVIRMLNNLRVFYMRQRDWRHAERVMACLADAAVYADPQIELDVMRDRGLMAFAQGRYHEAAQLINQYALRSPHAQDLAMLKKVLGPALDIWARGN